MQKVFLYNSGSSVGHARAGIVLTAVTPILAESEPKVDAVVGQSPAARVRP